MSGQIHDLIGTGSINSPTDSSNGTYNNCVVFVYKYLLLYCVYLYHLCEAHVHVWIRKPAVPCLSLSPVAAWLSFTVIVSAVQTQQVWRRPLWPWTAQSSYCRVCVCVCAQLYPCISTFYLNTLQHRLVTQSGSVASVLVGYIRSSGRILGMLQTSRKGKDLGEVIEERSSGLLKNTGMVLVQQKKKPDNHL